MQLSAAPTQLAKIAQSRLTPWRVQALRESRGLTRSEFGRLFRGEVRVNGYTRTYISKLERGKLPITDRFEREFYRVRDGLRAQPRERMSDHCAVELELVSAHPLKMKRLEILARPRKCDGCGRWFVPVQSRQKRHNDKGCHARAARKRRRGNAAKWRVGESAGTAGAVY